MAHDLILIRHSLPEIDPSRPSHLWPLSTEGKRRCVTLAEELRPHAPTRLVTSTEPKAQETGHIIAECLGLPVTSAPGLEEHKRSQSGFIDQATFKQMIAHLLTKPDTLVFGDETGHQAQHRYTQTVIHLNQTYPQDTLALVSHGTIITLFVAAFNQVDPVLFWNDLTLPDFLLLDNIGFKLKFSRKAA